MPEQHERSSWLARWRQPKRHRTVIDRLFGGDHGDSEEKVAQSRTRRGEELTADDRRYRIKGQGGGFSG
jgi:hypothetical protein